MVLQFVLPEGIGEGNLLLIGLMVLVVAGTMIAGLVAGTVLAVVVWVGVSIGRLLGAQACFFSHMTQRTSFKKLESYCEMAPI